MLQNKIVFAALSILSVISFTLADQPPIPVPNLASKKEKQKSEKLPPCKSCKNLASSFRKVSEKCFLSVKFFLLLSPEERTEECLFFRLIEWKFLGS